MLLAACANGDEGPASRRATTTTRDAQASSGTGGRAATRPEPAALEKSPWAGQWRSRTRVTSGTGSHGFYLELDITNDGAFTGEWAAYLCVDIPLDLVVLKECRPAEGAEAVRGRVVDAGRGTIDMASAGEAAFTINRLSDASFELHVGAGPLVATLYRAGSAELTADDAPAATEPEAPVVSDPLPPPLPGELPVPHNRHVLGVYEPTSPGYPLRVDVRAGATSLEATVAFLDERLRVSGLPFRAEDHRSEAIPYMRFEVQGPGWYAEVVAKPFAYGNTEVDIAYVVTFS